MHPNPDAIALLALGEDPASTEDRTHVGTCSVCTAQVEELARVVELGRLSDEAEELQTPDPAVWQRIRAELFETSARAAVAGSSGERSPAAAQAVSAASAVEVTDVRTPVVDRSAVGATSRRTRSLFALVAAVALIAGLGIGFGIARSGVPGEQQATAAVHLNGLPSWPGAEGEARLGENEQGDRVLIVQVTTPQPVKGHFEVWLSDDKALHMTDMGTMDASSDTFVIPPGMELTQSPVIDISLEPNNDPDPEHSKNSVVRGRLRI